MFQWLFLLVFGGVSCFHFVDAESIFINCGATENYNDGNNEWMSDRYFTSGSRFFTSSPISNTLNDKIYQSERWASDLRYEIPFTESGLYDVTLHFAEIYPAIDQAGKRVFDIIVGGIEVLKSADIFALTGSINAAFNVTVPSVQVNEVLVIELVKRNQNPKINAISIEAAGTVASTVSQAVTTTSTQVPLGTNSIFLNCGGPDYYDGEKWWKGDGSSGFIDSGFTYSVGNDIPINDAPIKLQPLYRSERYSSSQLAYEISGLDDGAYDISLHWAEIYGGAFGDGKREFGVVLLGADTKVLDVVDIYQSAGSQGNTAYIEKVTNFQVSGGSLMIVYVKGASNNPKASAIEIRPSSSSPVTSMAPSLPVTTATSTLEPVGLFSKYINCGSQQNFVDTQGRVWESDAGYYLNAGIGITVGSAIAETQEDGLYQSERYDPSRPLSRMKYSIPLNIGGSQEVQVTFHLAETYGEITSAGKRVFDIILEEGDVVLDGVDPFALAGNKLFTATTLSTTVTVTDGSLDVTFRQRMQNPKICGIEMHYGSGASTVVTTTASTAVATTTTTTRTSTSESTTTPSTSTTSTSTTSSGIQEAPVWIDLDENQSYTARHECSFVQAGDLFYLFGGRENPKKLEIYNYTSDTWFVGASPDYEFNHFQALEHEGLIWVIGSYRTNNFPNEVVTEDIHVYDPANDVWMVGPEIPASRRRGGAGLQVYDGKFYVVGGNTRGHKSGFVAWLDEYNPRTGEWRKLSDAPHARDHFHAAVVGNRLYAAGGRRTAHDLGDTFGDVEDKVDVYDFGMEAWLPPNHPDLPEDLPDPRAAAATAVFDGKILVAGGESGYLSLAHNDVHALDPSTGQWQRLTSLNHRRHGTQAIVSGPGVFVAGGSWRRGGGNQKNMEVYNANSPEGVKSEAGVLSAPSSINVQYGTPTTVTLQQVGGNQGIFLTTLTLAGNNFAVTNGVSAPLLIPNGGTLDIVVEYLGTEDNEQALLFVEYSGDETLLVDIVGKNDDTDQDPTPTTVMTTTTLSDLDIEDFLFVNAETDTDLGSIVNGCNGCVTTLTSVSIVAVPHVVEAVGSVHLTLSGPDAYFVERIEGVPPFALFGDDNGDFEGEFLAAGDYNVTAQASTGMNGVAGPLKWRAFTVS